MGRALSFDRYNVLENTLELFWQKGFSDTSLRQLENITELNPGSLYYHFINKEQLFLATLEHYIEHHLKKRIQKNLSSGNSLEGLRRFLTSSYRNNKENRYKNCCFLVHTCADVRLLPPPAYELVNSGLDAILAGFKQQLERAMQQKLIKINQAVVSKISQELLNRYLSLQLLAQVRHNQHQLDDMVKITFEYLLLIKKD